jgi:hypothetical protein
LRLQFCVVHEMLEQHRTTHRVFGCLYLLVLASRDAMSWCLVVVNQALRVRGVFGCLRADVESGSHDT